MKSADTDVIKVSRFIRLNYYNNFLFENGIITEREYQRMNNAILTKYHRTTHTYNRSNLNNIYKLS